MTLKDNWETGDVVTADALNEVAVQVNADAETIDSFTEMGMSLVTAADADEVRTTLGVPATSDLEEVATSGDYDDLSNKPTLGTAAATDATDYATAAQGALADSATQPGDLAAVATSGDYDDLSNKPTLGTAAATDSTDYATAAQGALADSATQPGDLAEVATSGDYDDLSNKPTWLDIANFPTGITHILDPNFTDNTMVRPKVHSAGTDLVYDGTVKRSGAYSMKITAGDGTFDGFAMGCIEATSIFTTGFGVVCTQDQQFYTECWVYVPSGQDNSAGEVELQLYLRGSGVSNLGVLVEKYSMAAITKNTWVKLSGTVTIQAGYELVNPNIRLDTGVTEGDVCYVDNFVFKEVTASGSGLATVATTGSYDDLTDKPSLPEGGMLELAEDTTPQLGGDLDLNGHDVGAASASDLTKLSELTVTSTELNRVDGVTSAIQPQLDALKEKLDTVESGAEVTSAAKVNAAGAVMNTDTTTAGMSFVIDQDDMSSNLNTKVPTQQSVKAYVDSSAVTGFMRQLGSTTSPTSGNYYMKIAEFSNSGDGADEVQFCVAVQDSPVGKYAEWLVHIGRGTVDKKSHITIRNLTDAVLGSLPRLVVVQTVTHVDADDPRTYQVFLQSRSTTASTLRIYVSQPNFRTTFSSWSWHGTTWQASLPSPGNATTSPIKYSDDTADLATFNVKDYGAVGDSVVDDTDAVQAAIDAAEAYAATRTWVRATVFFPSGTYKINGALTVVGDAIAFVGVDVSSSLIIRTVLSATPIITVQGEGFTMQNLYFRWTSGDPWWTPEQSVVLRLEHPQSGAYNNSIDAYINSCRMSGFYTGVSIYGQGLTVTDCFFGRMTKAFVLDFPVAADLLDKGDDDQNHVESGFRTFRFSDIHTQAVDTFIDNTGPNRTYLRTCLINGFTCDMGTRLWQGVMAGTVVSNFNIEWVTSNYNPIPVFELHNGSRDSIIMNGRYVGRQEITGATNPGGVGTSTIPERAVKNFLTCNQVTNLNIRNLHVQNVREHGFVFNSFVHGLYMSNVHFQDVGYDGASYRQIYFKSADTQAYLNNITFDIPASNTITPIGGYAGTSSTVIIGSNLVQVDDDHTTDYAIYNVNSTIVMNGAARDKPVKGTWKRGEVLWNRLGTSPLGWLCTASGSPGTWTNIYNGTP